MDADEREIIEFLKTFGEGWVSAKEVCRRAGGKKRFYEDNNWARPILQRLMERRLLEVDLMGRFRVRPESKKDRKPRWVSPDIEKILRESGVQVDIERADAASDESAENL
jgi:hypothetical protein